MTETGSKPRTFGSIVYTVRITDLYGSIESICLQCSRSMLPEESMKQSSPLRFVSWTRFINGVQMATMGAPAEGVFSHRTPYSSLNNLLWRLYKKASVRMCLSWVFGSGARVRTKNRSERGPPFGNLQKDEIHGENG